MFNFAILFLNLYVYIHTFVSDIFLIVVYLFQSSVIMLLKSSCLIHLVEELKSFFNFFRNSIFMTWVCRCLLSPSLHIFFDYFPSHLIISLLTYLLTITWREDNLLFVLQFSSCCTLICP